jgi:hypothetical protein
MRRSPGRIGKMTSAASGAGEPAGGSRIHIDTPLKDPPSSETAVVRVEAQCTLSQARVRQARHPSARGPRRVMRTRVAVCQSANFGRFGVFLVDDDRFEINRLFFAVGIRGSGVDTGVLGMSQRKDRHGESHTHDDTGEECTSDFHNVFKNATRASRSSADSRLVFPIRSPFISMSFSKVLARPS